jgi:PadR family transcriptional regulator
MTRVTVITKAKSDSNVETPGRILLHDELQRASLTLTGLLNASIIEDMRRPREYLGQLELMVLLAVAQPDGDAYGVQISKCIEAASGREVSLASVYAALERLERKGLIKSSLGEPTPERGGRARTYFKPTTSGLREARAAFRTLNRLSGGVPALKGTYA